MVEPKPPAKPPAGSKTPKKKPDRLPWEETPYINAEQATGKAIAAAQRAPVDPKSKVVVSWARSALEKETAKLAATPEGSGEQGGRNNQLFLSAANLFEIVAAGALDEIEVTDRLRDACIVNRLLADDTETQFNNTLASGRRKGLDNPRDLSGVGRGSTNGYINGASIGDEDKPDKISFDTIFTLEQGFWTLRESLQTIYLASLNLMCSPWGVLCCCVARALAMVRPNATLPPIVGGPGSLNWFGAVASKSGGGKSSVGQVAEYLVKGEVRERNLGSGEGLIDAYVKPADKITGDPAGLYESVMFVADEADNLAALANRAGSTLGSTLRSAFTGRALGFSYRQSSNLHLKPHSYRMTLVCNVQPARAGALMDDVYGGTLQRFMWFPGNDSRITAEIPNLPAPLTIPPPGTWQYPREIPVPYEATALIRDERVRFARGDADDLNGHAMFIREKFAFALALLDGRDQMTLQDWQLAGIASRISDTTRAWVAQELLEALQTDASQQGRLKGVQQFAAREEEAEQGTKIMARVTGWAIDKVRAAGKTGITNRELTIACRSTDRRWLKATLEAMKNDGSLRFDDAVKKWFTP